MLQRSAGNNIFYSWYTGGFCTDKKSTDLLVLYIDGLINGQEELDYEIKALDFIDEHAHVSILKQSYNFEFFLHFYICKNEEGIYYIWSRN